MKFSKHRVIFLIAGASLIIGHPTSFSSSVNVPTDTSRETIAQFTQSEREMKQKIVEKSVRFRVKSRSGKGLSILPKTKFRFGNQKFSYESLDTKTRWLHLTESSVVFEIEGNNRALIVENVETNECMKLSINEMKNIVKSSDYNQFLSSMKIDGIYGFFQLVSGPHVAVISKSKIKFADASKSVEFKQVSRLIFVPINNKPLILTEEQEKEESRQLELLRIGFSTHQLFFSHVHDVTQSMQRRASNLQQSHNLLSWRHSDERFFWNRNVLSPLINLSEEQRELGNDADSAIIDHWVVPIMSAFVQVESECIENSNRFDMLFVSRRGCLRPGMRYTRRGVDEEGNVANFVETEQVLFHEKGQVTAHVQIRGSIPLFWSSPVNLSYRPPVLLEEDSILSAQALRQHATQLAKYYGSDSKSLLFLNLVDKEHDQGKLGEALEKALNELKSTAVEEGSRWPYPPETLEYVWFDFHQECKGEGGWDNLSKLLDLVGGTVGKHGFFMTDNNGKVTQRQNGVVRTNCMDCLDRTNVVQSLLARYSLISQLRAVMHNNSITDDRPKDSFELNPEFERRFRNVWGNNADEISVLYAGTPALKGDFTRTGRRTKAGVVKDGANSILRYIINNFQDHRRQEAVDFMLQGKPPLVTASPSPSVQAWKNIRSSIDMDLWTKFSLPHSNSNAISAMVSINIRPRKLNQNTSEAACSGKQTSVSNTENSSDDEERSDAWKDDFSDWEGGERGELIVGGVDFSRVRSYFNDEQLGKLGMAALAFVTICGEITPKKLVALIGGLLLVPLLGLLR